MPKFNRRQFLGSTAAAAAFAAAPAIVQAAVVEKKVDLVIVGGGLAGLAAANAAVKKGVKPIVLEKEAFARASGRTGIYGHDPYRRYCFQRIGGFRPCLFNGTLHAGSS